MECEKHVYFFKTVCETGNNGKFRWEIKRFPWINKLFSSQSVICLKERVMKIFNSSPVNHSNRLEGGKGDFSEERKKK